MEIHLIYSVLLVDQASVWGVCKESGFLLYQTALPVPVPEQLPDHFWFAPWLCTLKARKEMKRQP